MPYSYTGTTVQIYDKTLSGLALTATYDGGTIPTTASVYALGCKMTDTTSGSVYQNTGTVAVPVWSLSGSTAAADPLMMKMTTVTQTAAQMILTTAGTLSHADGLTLVPAAPTGYVNVWHRTMVCYKYATAAFTGGGNTTVNIGGGAALSGLIATTTLWQNGSSINQEFVPLSTVAFPVTKETSINLVTASAITNPGTAAGTAIIYTWYSQVPIA